MAGVKSTGKTSLRIDQPPPTLREMALDRMRTAILEFHFKPGQRLIERDLCEQLGVSRSVVREVVRHLEAEGLIVTVPHQGPSVARLDAPTAIQIYELRALLESSAAEAAATLASEVDVQRLEAALQAIEKAYAQQNFTQVLAATNRFYEAMFTTAKKPVAWEVVTRLNGRISWLRSMTVASAGRSSAGPRQLRKILAAIRSGNVVKAGEACREHLKTASTIAQALLDQNKIGKQ